VTVPDGPVVVDVFADVGCPFAHVGLRMLARRRDELDRSDVVLRVWAWPLEWVNGRPLDAAFIAEEIDDLRAQLPVDEFAGFRQDAFPETFVPSMALAAAAYAQDLRLGESVSLALRTALFEQGRDVSDPAVLTDVAARCGFDPDAVPGAVADLGAVEAEYRSGRERAVVGSPHFFSPGGSFFCPSLDIARTDGGHLRITVDRAGFEAFVGDWLA
jgi:predicted DsbA family dithiol-disulfide isomerase